MVLNAVFGIKHCIPQHIIMAIYTRSTVYMNTCFMQKSKQINRIITFCILQRWKNRKVECLYLHWCNKIHSYILPETTRSNASRKVHGTETKAYCMFNTYIIFICLQFHSANVGCIDLISEFRLKTVLNVCNAIIYLREDFEWETNEGAQYAFRNEIC